MKMAGRRIEFIMVSHPGHQDPGDAGKRAHSHAARVAHARVRQQRVVDYQARVRSPPSVEENPGLDVWVPSPVALLASDRRDPFASFARPLKPVEHFLLDHYVQVVVPYLVLHCTVVGNMSDSKAGMVKDWLRLALTDDGLVCGILLSSCRHLSHYGFQEHQIRQLALAYKVTCLRALREVISMESKPAGDVMVAKALMLAFDEIMIKDYSTSREHVKGAVKMVEVGGGPQAIGLTDFVENLLHRFVHDKKLLELDPPPPCGHAFHSARE